MLEEWQGYSHYGARVQVGGNEVATLALSATFHPLWRASIDDMPRAVRRVTPDVMAVDVPPGIHAVQFHFRRAGWMWGLLAGDGLLIMGVVLGRVAWRRCAQCVELSWRCPAQSLPTTGGNTTVAATSRY